MQEIRCTKCGKLLGKVGRKQVKYFSVNVANSEITKIDKTEMDSQFDFDGFELEIKCPRCGELNTNKEKESV